MQGLNTTEYSFSGSNGAITPKNDKAKTAVEAFYIASKKARDELGCELGFDENSSSRMYQILAGNKSNPLLFVQYISGNRNYNAKITVGGKDVSISSLDSLVNQITASLLNPDVKVNEKRKKKSARLIAKPDAKVEEEFDLKYNSEEE